MIQVASCSSFVTSCIVRGKYEIRTLPSPSQFLFLEAEALVTRDHGAGALLGLLTLPISQKEMQNRTTLDTILLLITSFVYTYANVSFRRRSTQSLYLVHARLPEHGGHLSDRSRAAAETIPDPIVRLGSAAMHLHLQGLRVFRREKVANDNMPNRGADARTNLVETRFYI